LAIAAMALLQAFHPRIEPPLLLVEQTVEQDNGRSLLVGFGIRALPQDLAGGPLLLTPGPILGGIQIQALEILTLHSTGPCQLSQGIFDGHMHRRFQLRRQVAGGSFLHQRRGGVQEGAVAGKPRSTAQPDTLGIKLRNGF
jgi:hypothetical protein